MLNDLKRKQRRLFHIHCSTWLPVVKLLLKQRWKKSWHSMCKEFELLFGSITENFSLYSILLSNNKRDEHEQIQSMSININPEERINLPKLVIRC